MHTPRIPAPLPSPAAAAKETKPGFRTKTVATRLTPDELAEVENAAEAAGKSCAEWLRETALRAARESSADPVELLLAEQIATRSMLLNFFYAAATNAAEGKQLRPDSVLEIRDQSDAKKFSQAHKLLADFRARKAGEGSRKV